MPMTGQSDDQLTTLGPDRRLRRLIERRHVEEHSPEQHVGQQERPKHVKGLAPEERQRRPAALGGHQVGEAGFETDRRERQGEPKRAKARQQPFRFSGLRIADQKRQDEGRSKETQDKLWKAVPNDARVWALAGSIVVPDRPPDCQQEP